MIRNFFSTPNVLGRLMIVLLFAGGVVFAGAFDGFVVETEASCSCGGEAAVTTGGGFVNDDASGANSGKYCNKRGKNHNGVPQYCELVNSDGNCGSKCITTNKCKQSCG